MKYYRYLYMSEGLEEKKKKIIKRLESHRLLPGIQLITLTRTEKDQLEIFSADLLLQRDYPKEDLFVAGITASFDEALEMVEEILQEVYNETGGTDIRSYILKKEQED